MKKSIVLIAFLCFNMVAFCQTTYGIHIGRNVSNFTFNKDSLAKLGITNTNLAGLSLAIPIEFRVGKNVTIEAELGFLKKTFQSAQSILVAGTTSKFDFKNATNYAILPVKVRFHTSGRLLQLYANVGPSAAYAISSTSKGTQTVGSTTTEISKDNNLDGTNRLPVGLQGGAGLKLKLGIVALVFDGRFLTDLKDSNGNFNYQGLKDNAFKTNGWTTSFGFVFGR